MKPLTSILALVLACQAHAATLIVTSDPSGAEVSLDGKQAGTTPYRKWLAAGTYELTLRLAGYEDLVQTVNLGDKLLMLKLELQQKTLPVDIMFKSINENTMNWRALDEDGTDIGAVPGTLQLPKGKVKLLLVKDGFKDVSVDIEVSKDLRTVVLDDPIPGKSSGIEGKAKQPSNKTTTMVLDFRKCRSPKDVSKEILFKDESKWRIINGELRCQSNRGFKYNYAMLRTRFKSITAVHIYGRIVGPGNCNFRIGAGPMNLVFNCLSHTGCEYKDGARNVCSPGYVLTSGKPADFLITLRGNNTIVYVDKKEVFRTSEKLSGTVAVYPANGSEIGITLIAVQGVPEETPATEPVPKLYAPW